jgi:hypothetical protein
MMVLCRVHQAVEPEQQLQKLQELQQLTSSLLAAAAELAKQGVCSVHQEIPSSFGNYTCTEQVFHR